MTTRKSAITPSPRKVSRIASRPAHLRTAAISIDDCVVSLLITLPTECLIEILHYLEIHELLDAAWTCRRIHAASQDMALWGQTHFSTADWQAVLQRHFIEDQAWRAKDHTGVWTRRVCTLTQVRYRFIKSLTHAHSSSLTSSSRPLHPLQASLMCREVVLDYVDPGEGVCYRLLRSVSCLQQLQHPNIVPLVLINLETDRNQLRLFYEDAGRPLEECLKSNGRLPLCQAREVIRQILSALAHCHCQGITHRNLKPKYVLLRTEGQNMTTASGASGSTGGSGGPLKVKLSDFNSVRWLGVQRHGSEEPLYGATNIVGACSPTVVTQPYRAPEILLGCTSYTTSIDIWACGCVLAEMCSEKMLFAGDSDLGQIIKIFELLGTPMESSENKWVEWPGVESLPYYRPLDNSGPFARFPAMRPKPFGKNPATRELCSSPAAEDLLRRMLFFDPTKRITAAEALQHPFLQPEQLERPLAGGAATSGQQPLMQETPIVRTPAASISRIQSHQVAPAVSPEHVSAEPVFTTPGGVMGAALAAGESINGEQRGRSWGELQDARPSSSAAATAPSSRLCVWQMWRSIETAQRGHRSSAHAALAGVSSRTHRSYVHGTNKRPPPIRDEWSAYACSRELALRWILRSALEFCKCDRTVHLALAILDHVAGRRPPLPSHCAAVINETGSWVELLGIATLLLACKFQEVEIHMVDEFVYHANSKYSSSDVLAAEVAICSVLRLDFAIPSSLDFLYCLLHRLRWPTAFAVHRGLHKQVAMLAQLLCELALFSVELCICERSSLVAACSLCLSLACLRCGVWRDGSPGPAASPEQYWTPSMVHATGYSRTDLTAALALLHALHEVASPELSHEPSDVLWGRFGVVKYKFSEPRFLGVLNVMPFTPHSGGSLYSPLHAELVRTTPAYNQSLNTPLAQPPQPPPVPGGVFVDEVAFVDPFAVAAAQEAADAT